MIKSTFRQNIKSTGLPLRAFFVSFFLIYTSICLAQSGPVYDNFSDRSQIFLERAQGLASAQYGNTFSQFTAQFGQPDSISTMYWEMSEVTATYYHYHDGLEVAFVDGKLESLYLSSSNYLLKLGSDILRVGNHKNTLQVYPLTYNNFKNGGTVITLDHGDHEYYLIDTEDDIIISIDQRVF